MTIVLGLKTPQGAILAADTQETYEQSHKVNRPKLVYKSDTNLTGLPLVFSVAGAGVGPWVDKLTTTMWESIQDAANLDEACGELETTIKNQYSEFRDLLSFDPTAELIYAVGCPGGVRLFHAYGALVNEEPRLRAAGSGQAIADFLLRNFEGKFHITNAMAFAVYVLMCAKRHSDGCGGQTQIALVHRDGWGTELGQAQIAASEKCLDVASEVSDMVLMLSGNPVMGNMDPSMSTAAVTGAMGGLSRQIADSLTAWHNVSGIKELLARISSADEEARKGSSGGQVLKR